MELSEVAYLLLRRMVNDGELIPCGYTGDPEYRASLSQAQIEIIYASPRLVRIKDKGIWFWKKSFYVPSDRGEELAGRFRDD